MKKYLFISMAVALTAILVVSCNNFGTKIDVDNGEVYYLENVDESDAQKIADWLEVNFFPAAQEKASVQVDKDGDLFIVKFVTIESADLESDLIKSAFTIVQTSLSKELDGAAVEVWLCDRSFEMLKKFEWDKNLKVNLDFGERIETANGELYYKNVSAEDAQALADYLEPNYFEFQKNSSVQFDRKGESYVVNFVFRDDVDVENESLISSAILSQIEISKLFENSPVTINFCNSIFESRKEIPWDAANVEKYNFGAILEVTDGELYYTEAITIAEAEKLAAWLETNYFAEQKNTSAQVTKEGKTIQVKFVMRAGLDLEAQEVVDFAADLKTGISKLFKPATVEIHLCNSVFETQKVF